jgi:hypothetical protein
LELGLLDSSPQFDCFTHIAGSIGGLLMPATGLFTVLFQSLVAQINSCTMICAPIIDFIKGMDRMLL